MLFLEKRVFLLDMEKLFWLVYINLNFRFSSVWIIIFFSLNGPWETLTSSGGRASGNLGVDLIESTSGPAAPETWEQISLASWGWRRWRALNPSPRITGGSGWGSSWLSDDNGSGDLNCDSGYWYHIGGIVTLIGCQPPIVKVTRSQHFGSSHISLNI